MRVAAGRQERRVDGDSRRRGQCFGTVQAERHPKVWQQWPVPAKHGHVELPSMCLRPETRPAGLLVIRLSTSLSESGLREASSNAWRRVRSIFGHQVPVVVLLRLSRHLQTGRANESSRQCGQVPGEWDLGLWQPSMRRSRLRGPWSTQRRVPAGQKLRARIGGSIRLQQTWVYSDQSSADRVRPRARVQGGETSWTGLRSDPGLGHQRDLRKTELRGEERSSELGDRLVRQARGLHVRERRSRPGLQGEGDSGEGGGD